jgi:hypothetical protein
MKRFEPLRRTVAMGLHRAFRLSLYLPIAFSILLWIQSYWQPFDVWTKSGTEVASDHGELFVGLRAGSDVGVPIPLPYWVATSGSAALLFAAWWVRRRRNRLRRAE